MGAQTDRGQSHRDPNFFSMVYDTRTSDYSDYNSCSHDEQVFLFWLNGGLTTIFTAASSTQTPCSMWWDESCDNLFLLWSDCM